MGSWSYRALFSGIAFAVCACGFTAARANALAEACPARLLMPLAGAGTSAAAFAFAIVASDPRTVRGHIIARTDHGWYQIEFPDQRLAAASLHYVRHGNTTPAIRVAESPILYARFAQPLTIVSAWVQDAMATGDGVWAARGSVTCDPPQRDPLDFSEPRIAKLAPVDLAPFLVPPGSSSAIAAAAPTAAYGSTDCLVPFATARATNLVPPQAPFGSGPATSLIEILLAHNGEVQDAEVMRTSGDRRLDAAALQAARQTTYSPAIAYCRPVYSVYVFKADFR